MEMIFLTLFFLFLSFSFIQNYAGEGLRTLVCAKKDLTVEEYTSWAELYQEARYIRTSLRAYNFSLDPLISKLK